MSIESPGQAAPAGPVIVLPARVTPADVPPLCARLSELYGQGAPSVDCDLAAVERADLAVVEALARLRLAARRAGRGIRVVNAGPGVRALLTLVGLDHLAGPAPRPRR
ncbi:STAS domain-containing protein [Streptomyces yaizuensis]|uniref:STAS domain-containing protein n=1 Tax=Streptomyces yaizuensis TaxID=2989713 RepID=A0ABQ5P597_9ACTN|nr:STAS domain-containing protein [Streptomyces sp. YSPA8]GLF97735.1 STAS domain-containing protein [Streptomyces sp. YSPA8]